MVPRPGVLKSLIFPVLVVGWATWYAWSVWEASSRVTSTLLVVPTALLVLGLALYCAFGDVVRGGPDKARSAVDRPPEPVSDVEIPDLEVDHGSTTAVQSVLVVATLAYALAIGSVGYLIATSAYVAVVYANMTRELSSRALVKMSVLIVCVVGIVWMVFVQLLGVRLP